MISPDIGSALIGAGGTLLSGIGSLFGSSAAQRRSEELMQKQMDWQERMMGKQQDYWHEQFKTINDYNDPKNVVGRYLGAGISPSAAFSGSTVGQSSATPASPTSGVSPVGYPPTLQNPAQMFSTIGQALQSFSTAFKNTNEGMRIQKLLGEEYVNFVLSNDSKRFLLSLDKQNLPKKQKQEIAVLFAEQQRLVADADLASEERLTEIEKRYKTIAERQGELIHNDLLRKEYDSFDQRFQMSLREARSRISANYGSANASNAGARQSNAIASREEYFNNLRNDDQARQSLLTQIRQAGRQAVAQRKLTQNQAAQMFHLASQAAYADSHKEFDYYFNKIREIGADTRDGARVGAQIIDSIVPF